VPILDRDLHRSRFNQEVEHGQKKERKKKEKKKECVRH